MSWKLNQKSWKNLVEQQQQNSLKFYRWTVNQHGLWSLNQPTLVFSKDFFIILLSLFSHKHLNLFSSNWQIAIIHCVVSFLSLAALNVHYAIKVSDSSFFENVLTSLRKMYEHIDIVYRLHNWMLSDLWTAFINKTRRRLHGCEDFATCLWCLGYIQFMIR